MNQKSLQIKSRFITLVLLFLIGCGPTLTPSPTATLAPLNLYVETTGNDLSNDCLSVANACLTLKGALNKSTPGSTINFGIGDFITSPGGGPAYIRNNIILIGAGPANTTLHSDDNNYVLQLPYPVNVIVRNITIDYATDVGTPPPGVPSRATGIELRDGVNLTLENCTVQNNGVGVSLFSGATATIRNCLFRRNETAIANGGTLIVADSTFRRNLTALGNSGIASVDNSVFDQNGEFDEGSGAATTTISNYRSGNLTMDRSTISRSAGFAFILQDGSAQLNWMTVSNNVNSGIWHQQGVLTINSSVISDNGSYGVEIGGRSEVADVGVMNINNTAILRNGFAGLRVDRGEVHAQNITISGNVGRSSQGGGIWGYGGNIFLLDSTVAYNTGYGIHLGVVDGSPNMLTIQRSVVALNSDTECSIDPRTSQSVDLARFVCSESWTATSLKLQPLVEDGGTFVHPLGSGSPLIDAAGPVGSCPHTDQRGFGRPVGTTCDVGAYERGGSASAAIVIGTPEPTVGIIPLYTDTPSPIIPIVTLTKNANCRVGPSTQYNLVTAIELGKSGNAEGRNETNSWWLVNFADAEKPCWVSNTTLTITEPFDQLPIITLLPLPETPSNFVIAKRNCAPKLYEVILNWSSVNGATGYNVYLDGILIGMLKANATELLDKPAHKNDHTYEIEAFNENGVSLRASVHEALCP